MLDSDRMKQNIEMGKSMAEDETGQDLPNVFRDDRGQMQAMRVVQLVVALTVGAIVAAFLLPIGLSELNSADIGANASSGATALWDILDVIIVLAVFLFFIGIALATTGRI